MTVYILIPINEVDNLPDGPYPVSFGYHSYTPTAYFKKGKWDFPTYEKFTHYLRPLEDVITVTREEAGKIWDAGNAATFNSPEQQTYIDQLFKEKQ